MAYSDDRARLDRRRGMAQALIQMGTQPQGAQFGRTFVGPTPASTLASLAGIIAGGVMDRRLEKKERALDESHRSELANALRAFTGEGTPAIPGAIDESGATGTPPVVTGIGDMAKGSMPSGPASGPAADPRRAAAMAVLQGLPLDQMQGLVGQQAIANLFPKPQKLEPVDLGNEIGFRDDSGNIVRRVAKGAAPQGQTDDQREYDAARQQGFQGTLRDWILTNKKAGATSVTVDTRQENEENKAVGKAFGEQYAGILKSGLDAAGKIDRLDRIEGLLQGVETGKLTPATTQVAALAQSIGLDIDPNLDAKQAVQALSNEIALQARNPSGGAGMPGALSDSDRKFLVSMTPGLANTPGGNKLIIETARKLAQRDREVAELARQYRAKHGSLDEGFYSTLADFSTRNPLFDRAAAPAEAPSAPDFSSLSDDDLLRQLNAR